MVKTYVKKITNQLYVLRLDDDIIRYFEAIWYIPEGITYNSYLLVTSEGAILFDTWKGKFSNDFIEALRKVIDLKDLKYIVVHHMEPDHSGSLPKVLELTNYKPVVLGHTFANALIKSFYGINVRFKSLRDGEELKFGDYTLRFIHTPWLHWPETIMTYINELEILLSCDAFGSYGIPKAVFDDELSKNELNKVLDEARKYMITVVGHYKDFIVKAVEKLKKLNIKLSILAPSHGLIWRGKPDLIVNEYVKWVKGRAKKGKVVIIYSSMYGFTAKAMGILVNVLKRGGANVKIYELTDESRPNVVDILSDIVDASAIVIGTSTYETDIFPELAYIVNLISEKTPYNKPLAVITSYGWGPAVSRKIITKLSKAGYNVVDSLDFRGSLTKELEGRLRDLANKLLSII